MEVADRSYDRQCDSGIHAGDGHQPTHLGTGQGFSAELPIDGAKFLTEEIKLTQQPGHGLPLIGGQVLCGQPRPAFVAEQVCRRAARDQVAVQHRLDLVLDPGPLADQVGAAHHQPTKQVCPLIRHPHRR